MAVSVHASVAAPASWVSRLRLLGSPSIGPYSGHPNGPGWGRADRVSASVAREYRVCASIDRAMWDRCNVSGGLRIYVVWRW